MYIRAKRRKEADFNERYKNRKKIKKIKACAYVRVSTKQDEQEESFDTQMRYWEGKLKSDPSLDFVGIFSDEGISGRKVEQRTGYQRMMELVRQGEIDRIYVKSVSRFGRNKLEALRAIQEVRNYNAEIIFEKENLTTSDPKSSFL
ncbi:MAG: recombinase family protein [Bacilli bacterium]|nr:recombinase family protein [Bacilli bacterium]